MDEQELLTVDQLAERLHVGPRTVQLWARRKRIPSIKISAKVVRFAWTAVMTALHDLEGNREAESRDPTKLS